MSTDRCRLEGQSIQTISDEYRLQQIELHKNPGYGVASVSFAPFVADLIKRLKFRSISDYGAGKKRLRDALSAHGISDIEYFPYDPAFPEYGEPRSADLVCCIDVLEHIEPEFLPSVLAELRVLVTNTGFLTVHCSPAKKILSDGRNAHLIQQPVAWWSEMLGNYFKIVYFKEFQGEVSGAMFLVTKKKSETIPNSL